MSVEKTVFISYRRTNIAWALAVYQYLSKNAYDVFFDFTSINNGDFEQIIIENIKSRAHFLLILTPSALERCAEPNDWLRREIEVALDEKRNIVPLMLEGFDYSSPAMAKYLTGKLALLPKYNAVRVPMDYFEEAMARLCNNYFNVPLELVIHPRSALAEAAATTSRNEANRQERVTEKKLSAQEWFEKGFECYEAGKFEDAIICYSEAIRLKPDFADAYIGRGEAKISLGKFSEALPDTNEAIRLAPDNAAAQYNRGIIYYMTKDYNKAIRDFNEAILLNPEYSLAYNGRGLAYQKKGDLIKAIQDYSEALRLKPDYALAYNNRAWTSHSMGKHAEGLVDVNKSLALMPNNANALHTRGAILMSLGNIEQSLQDFEASLQINPNSRNVQKELIKAQKLLRK